MEQAIIEMINRHKPKTYEDYNQALKEALQEIILLGLWRGKFFENAGFYGGTALRLFNGLDRFSEDLDFSLLLPDSNFNLKKYFPYIKNELAAFGFETEITIKEKPLAANIESAFVKTDTKTQLIQIGIGDRLLEEIPVNKLIKVKFEVDINPPRGFNTEVKYLLNPIPFSVRLYDPSSLFAGKIHALLYRKWQSRVKGRDWYDLVFFIGKSIPVNLAHLKARMAQSGEIEMDIVLNKQKMMEILKNAIENTNFTQAKSDVTPFIKNPDKLEVWSTDFFLSVVEGIEVI